MNKFVKAMSFIGGANLDILEKCSTEKNGFVATGVGIINVVIFSLTSMAMTMYAVFNGNLALVCLISVFYAFVIFIGYWGILSVVRRTIKYEIYIKMFGVIGTILTSSVSTISIEKYILKNNFSLKSSPPQYFILLFIFLLANAVYLIPIILKMLINSSTYEEEKDRIEHNFLTQKEADIIAYREKYQEYALMFNDANVKMDSIKHLGDISKEYHIQLEKTQKETFEYIDKLIKANISENKLLDDCKNNVEEQFKMTLDKMSKMYKGI
jgi:hypothetical protein